MNIQYDNNRNDGFGGQYMGIISIYCYCLTHDCEYIHKQIKYISSASSINHISEKDINDDKLLINVNKLIGIPESKRNSEYIKTHILSVYSDPNKYFIDSNLEIIKKYYSGYKKTLNQISIHIRRGNVDNDRHPRRYTPNQRYISIINSLLKKYDYDIYLYSEGNPSDFNDLLFSDRVKLKLNEDIIETHSDLVNSKILIISKSSFSYSAGLLNNNTVYTIYNDDSWVHKNISNWIYI